MYGRGNAVNDVWTANGYIKCVADIYGVPDITLSLKNAKSSLSSITLHECAQPLTEMVCDTIIFSPPLGNFTLGWLFKSFLIPITLLDVIYSYTCI